LFLRQPTKLQCFVKGECQEGNYLGSSILANDSDCLDYCHQLKGCKWFTYRPSNKVCQAFLECAILNSSGCQDCISGEASCRSTGYCETKGMCTGSLLSTVIFDFWCRLVFFKQGRMRYGFNRVSAYMLHLANSKHIGVNMFFAFSGVNSNCRRVSSTLQKQGRLSVVFP
jgi:hypothetical protein